MNVNRKHLTSSIKYAPQIDLESAGRSLSCWGMLKGPSFPLENYQKDVLGDRLQLRSQFLWIQYTGGSLKEPTFILFFSPQQGEIPHYL